eukprot:16445895-Heterocapsa_arctica.AAC.1
MLPRICTTSRRRPSANTVWRFSMLPRIRITSWRRPSAIRIRTTLWRRPSAIRSGASEAFKQNRLALQHGSGICAIAWRR